VLNNLSFIARNKTGVFLLVLSLIVGGVGAQATGLLNTDSGGYLVCVNSKTKVVTHPGTSTCPKGSKKLVLGAQGEAGVDGLTGSTGAQGPIGLTGSTGAQGPIGLTGSTGAQGPIGLTGSTGAQGPIGLTGATGPQGPSGGSGPAGPAGTNGINATIAITELFVCDGPDAGTVADEKCKIGMTGPGGGTIFFVDYNDIYPTFNYLEAAPTSCESASKTWSSATTVVTAAGSWAGRAVGAGQANTVAIKAVFTGDTTSNNAAHFATSCSAGGKSDWFLGSLGEMKLMYDNLQGVGGFVEYSYWSSTDRDAINAWIQVFDNGSQSYDSKILTRYVRPVRAF
jgi:hypothetical protein